MPIGSLIGIGTVEPEKAERCGLKATGPVRLAAENVGSGSAVVIDSAGKVRGWSWTAQARISTRSCALPAKLLGELPLSREPATGDSWMNSLELDRKDKPWKVGAFVDVLKTGMHAIISKALLSVIWKCEILCVTRARHCRVQITTYVIFTEKLKNLHLFADSEIV